MRICPHCRKQYSDEASTCPADFEQLKPLTQPVDEYLGRFLTDLPYDFEELPEIGPNVRGFTGDMPLHIATCRGDKRAIELLLEAGADINARGEDDFTPLHYATEQDKPGAVRLLLERGADRYRRDRFGQLPKDIAEMVSPELLSILTTFFPSF